MFKLLTTVALLGVTNATTHADATGHDHTLAMKTATSAATAPKIKDHSKSYKFQTCRECLEGDGIMCSTNDGSNYNQVVYNAAYKTKGTCCKVGSTDKACTTDPTKKYYCSQPVLGTDNTAKWQDILTTTNGVARNMQMIAYCPITSKAEKNCGFLKERNIELTDAHTEAAPKKIKLTGTKNIDDAKGDSCWWTVHAPKVDQGKSSTKTIHMKVTKNKGMEAYAYGGDSKATALKPIRKGNMCLLAGEHQVYHAAEGIMLTALPTKDEPGAEFEVEMWIGPMPETGVYSSTFVAAASATGLIIVLIISMVMVLVLVAVILKMRMAKAASSSDVQAIQLPEESIDAKPAE